MLTSSKHQRRMLKQLVFFPHQLVFFQQPVAAACSSISAPLHQSMLQQAVVTHQASMQLEWRELPPSTLLHPKACSDLAMGQKLLSKKPEGRKHTFNEEAPRASCLDALSNQVHKEEPDLCLFGL